VQTYVINLKMQEQMCTVGYHFLTKINELKIASLWRTSYKLDTVS